MGYFLLDNPPASRQFHTGRPNGLSGGVVIHTTEGVGGDDSAENTARYIARRSTPGSYHMIVDTNSSVPMLPDDHVAFGVAASGYNSRCWMIAIAAQSAALNPDSPESQTEIDRMGHEIVEFWRRNGIDPKSAAQFIGEEVKDRPGLAHHGDVQPSDRSDAWSRREDRWIFDSMLVQAIERHSGEVISTPPPVALPELPESAVWQQGSTGDKVRAIQGIVGVPQDGVYGPLTAQAVNQWQANLGLAADGIWGPRTEEATNNLFAFLANLPVVQEVAPNNPFFEALNEAVKQIVRPGASGGPVKMIQASLNGRGYPLVADGTFGPRTEAALRKFQSDRGLTSDGIVGPKTWAALVS